MKLFSDSKNRTVEGRIHGIEHHGDPLPIDPLASLDGPTACFEKRDEDPGIPLPAQEWDRVSLWARAARSSFLERGHAEVMPLERSMTAVEAALISLEERRPHRAIRLLREAEVAIGIFDRTLVAHSATRPDSIRYGCSLAIENLKETVGQCIRAAVSDRPAALVRARISLEDAAMCVLAAAARER